MLLESGYYLWNNRKKEYIYKEGLWMAILTKEQWLKRKSKKKKLLRIIRIVIIITFILSILLIIRSTRENLRIFKSSSHITSLDTKELLTIEEMLLTPNPYSRPQTPLYEVNSIVVHYTGNPATTAKNNRNYFENLKSKHTTYASSHYIIGLEGELIQCIPLNEVAYASNHRNNDSISIEACHPDSEGKFTEDTYHSLVALVALLIHQYQLDREDIIRHYDVTGKKCPLYYVENPDEWEQFRDDVMDYIEEEIL